MEQCIRYYAYIKRLPAYDEVCYEFALFSQLACCDRHSLLISFLLVCFIMDQCTCHHVSCSVPIHYSVLHVTNETDNPHASHNLHNPTCIMEHVRVNCDTLVSPATREVSPNFHYAFSRAIRDGIEEAVKTLFKAAWKDLGLTEAKKIYGAQLDLLEIKYQECLFHEMPESEYLECEGYSEELCRCTPCYSTHDIEPDEQQPNEVLPPLEGDELTGAGVVPPYVPFIKGLGIYQNAVVTPWGKLFQGPNQLQTIDGVEFSELQRNVLRALAPYFASIEPRTPYILTEQQVFDFADRIFQCCHFVCNSPLALDTFRENGRVRWRHKRTDYGLVIWKGNNPRKTFPYNIQARVLPFEPTLYNDYRPIIDFKEINIVHIIEGDFLTNYVLQTDNWAFLCRGSTIDKPIIDLYLARIEMDGSIF